MVQLALGDHVAMGMCCRRGQVPRSVWSSPMALCLACRLIRGMVLDNLVYQPGGSTNTLNFSIVQGTFSFVAGQVAPTGDMKIETPVATMGIRGTAPVGICSVGGPCNFILIPNPGTNHVGEYLLIGKDVHTIASVNTTDHQLTVFADGSYRTEPIDPSFDQAVQQLIQAFEHKDAALDEDNGGGPDGTHRASSGGSGIISDGVITSGLVDVFAQMVNSESQAITSEAREESQSTTDTTTVPDTGSSNPIIQNQPPTFGGSESGNAVEDVGTSTSGTVIVNDPDGGSQSGVQAQSGTAGTYGVFAIDADGNWTYTLNNDSAAVQALGGNDQAHDIFIVVSADGSATTTIDITVAGTNDVAVIGGVATGSVSEDSAQPLTGTLTVSDVDTGQSFFQPQSGTEGSHGSFAITADGAWSFTVNNADPAVQALRYEETLTEIFNVQSVDGTTSQVTVTINGVNDAPVASPVTLPAAAEDGGSVTITAQQLLAGASDIDSSSLTITSLTLASETGSLVDNHDGTWTYTPAANDDTGAVFNYTVSDGELSASSTATLDLTPVNDAPVASPVTLPTAVEDGGSVTITAEQLLAGASDIDSSSLTITSLTLASETGSLVDNHDGTWTYTPAANDDTGAVFNYTVSDGELSASSTATLDLTPVNDAPVASPVTLPAAAEDGGSVTITAQQLLAGASDIDSSSLTITSLTLASETGSLVDNHDGTWTYTPAANDDTGAVFNYTVSDGELSASSTATLDLTPVNDAPVASPVTLPTAAEDGGSVTITAQQLLAGASDIDSSSLTITSLTLASETGSLVDNHDGTWTYTPAANDDTGAVFNYTVSDGELSASSTATLDLTPVNDAPVAVADTLSAIEDRPVTYTAAQMLGNDTDIDNLGSDLHIASVTSGAGGDAVLNVDGTVTFTPNANFSGAADFSYTVSDGSATSASATVTVNVGAVADAPSLTVGSVSEGGAVNQGFETGDFTGWATIGQGSVVTQSDGYSPTDGSYLAVLNTNGASQENIESFLGLSQNTLDQQGNGDVTSGAATELQLQVTAGDVVTFDWNFVTTDYLPYNDYAAVTINGQVVELTDVAALGNLIGNTSSTGWETFSYTATESGTLNLGFAVLDVGDTVVDLHLLIDNLQVGIALDISASPTDTDGSENLSIVISGVPEGAHLSAGSNNGDGSWTLTPQQLAGLLITPPPGSSENFTLTVSAISTEASNGDTATTTQTIDVIVAPTDTEALNFGATAPPQNLGFASLATAEVSSAGNDAVAIGQKSGFGKLSAEGKDFSEHAMAQAAVAGLAFIHSEFAHGTEVFAHEAQDAADRQILHTGDRFAQPHPVVAVDHPESLAQAEHSAAYHDTVPTIALSDHNSFGQALSQPVVDHFAALNTTADERRSPEAHTEEAVKVTHSDTENLITGLRCT